MRFQDEWDSWTSYEKAQFQYIVRILSSNTFIVRDKSDSHKKAFFFAKKHTEAIAEYVGYMGFEIVANWDDGVVMLRDSQRCHEGTPPQAGHVKLKKSESILGIVAKLFTLL